MRTIGKKFKKLVKKEVIKALKRRDAERPDDLLRYMGIKEEIIHNLPDEIWNTWEGAYDEVMRIIEETDVI
ncbi:MAG: hypothetical protein NC833_03145 [Candidatus Omnitrophica bacterium]|nr:hypothetical protein [Candidatus Omnitrophota bacterium]